MFRSLSLLFTTSCLLHAGPGDFIRQIQSLNGNTVIYDIGISNDNGQVISKPLEADTAVFQLYALETDSKGNQTFTKLDEDTVGSFLAEVTAQVLSEDPYFPPRTRADEPYALQVTINGMETDNPAVPGYAKKCTAARSYALYDPSTYLATGVTGEYEDKYDFHKNGSFTTPAFMHLLPEPAERPTKACGEESFTVFMKETGNSPRSELAKATIQIWPVAECDIQNLVEGETYRSIPTDARLVLRDLYPDSETYAQVYPGGKAPGTVGTQVPNTVYPPPSDDRRSHQPQNPTLPLPDLETLLTVDGEYTLEVLTKTPFNNREPELLNSVTFTIKRVITLNGMFSTME